MKVIAAVGALLMWVFPISGMAQAASWSADAPNSVFSLRVSSAHFDGTQTYVAGSDGILKGVDVQISLPAAVQLDGDVPADLVKAVGGSKSSPLSAGTILYVGDDSQTTYCGHDWSYWNQQNLAPCLTDTDGDGRFDQGARNDPCIKNPTHLAYNAYSKTLHGVLQLGSPSVTFPTPVPYHRIDTAGLPASRVPAQIQVLSDFDKKRPGPVHVQVAVWQSGAGAFGSLYSRFQEVTYSGSPVDLYLFGLKVAIVGIDEKGRPICKLEGQIDEQIQPFVMQNVTLSMRFVYY